jgi:hypothetical protein
VPPPPLPPPSPPSSHPAATSGRPGGARSPEDGMMIDWVQCVASAVLFSVAPIYRLLCDRIAI